MKRDSLDEALRRKLHDAEAGLPVPPWAEMQRRMQLHANAHPAERVPLFRSWSRYAAAAVVLLGIGLGVWRVQRTHSWGEKSMAETVALPLPVSGSGSEPNHEVGQVGPTDRSPFESVDCAPRQSERRRRCPVRQFVAVSG